MSANLDLEALLTRQQGLSLLKDYTRSGAWLRFASDQPELAAEIKKSAEFWVHVATTHQSPEQATEQYSGSINHYYQLVRQAAGLPDPTTPELTANWDRQLLENVLASQRGETAPHTLGRNPHFAEMHAVGDALSNPDTPDETKERLRAFVAAPLQIARKEWLHYVGRAGAHDLY